jgi:hypothetical protein
MGMKFVPGLESRRRHVTVFAAVRASMVKIKRQVPILPSSSFRLINIDPARLPADFELNLPEGP